MNAVKRFFMNDNVMLVLVLINTGIIFVSGFSANYAGILLIADSVFTMLFLLEAVVKIKDRGFAHYWSDGRSR